MNPYMYIYKDDPDTMTPCLTHSVYVLLMMSQSIADDIQYNYTTIFKVICVRILIYSMCYEMKIVILST